MNSPDKGVLRGCIAVVQRVYDKTGGRGRRRRIYRRNRWKLIGHCARPPHRKLGLINLAFCNQSSFCCCKLLRQQRALTLRKGQMNCWYNAEILFDSPSLSSLGIKNGKKLGNVSLRENIESNIFTLNRSNILWILLLLFISYEINLQKLSVILGEEKSWYKYSDRVNCWRDTDYS